MGKKTFIIFFILSFSMFFSTMAIAATIYVNALAIGRGSGTITDPYSTIQDGIDAARYGDHVRVASGNYPELITLRDGIKVYAGPRSIIDAREVSTAVTAIGVDNNAMLNGFIIINGNGGVGGGMYIEDSSLKVRYCTFENNRSLNSGGGMYITNASPEIRGCIFRDNVTETNNGGGMCISGSSYPIIEDCTFEDNRAPTAIRIFGYGGGLNIIGIDSGARITDCTFLNNYAYRAGGGISVYNSTAVIERCVFKGNRTSTNYYYKGSGGAIYCERGTQVWILNSTLWKNVAKFGSGVYSGDGAQSFLINCTLYRNGWNHYGGTLYCSETAILGVSNSIIWDNANPQIASERGGTLSVRHCNVERGFAGDGNIDEDPRFVDAPGGNFHLQSDSPCIDSGTNLWIMPDIDIDGDDRIIDGDEDGVSTVDMGIDEYNPWFMPRFRLY